MCYQGDKTVGARDEREDEAARSDATEADAGGVNKKHHATASKRNSNKFAPKLEEIQEEHKLRREKKSSPTFEIPPSLDSGIVTRSVSSHSQSNDDDYNDASDDESDDDSEFLSKDDMKMFGSKTQKVAPDENDIVSDIYSTAFSKVPKVGIKIIAHVDVHPRSSKCVYQIVCNHYVQSVVYLIIIVS